LEETIAKLGAEQAGLEKDKQDPGGKEGDASPALPAKSSRQYEVDLAELRSKVAQESLRADQLLQEKSQIAFELAALELSRKQLEAEFDELQSQYSEANEAELDLDGKVDALQQTIAQLEKDLAEAKARADDRREEQRLEADLFKVRNELDTAKTQAADAAREADEARQSAEDLEKQNEKLDREVDTLQQRIAQLEKELVDAEALADDKQEEQRLQIAALEQDKAEMAAESSALQKEVDSLRSECQELTEKEKELQGQLGQIRAKESVLLQAVKSVKSETAASQRKADSAAQERIAAEKRAKLLEANLRELREQLEAEQSQNQVLREQLAAYKEGEHGDPMDEVGPPPPVPDFVERVNKKIQAPDMSDDHQDLVASLSGLDLGEISEEYEEVDGETYFDPADDPVEDEVFVDQAVHQSPLQFCESIWRSLLETEAKFRTSMEKIFKSNANQKGDADAKGIAQKKADLINASALFTEKVQERGVFAYLEQDLMPTYLQALQDVILCAEEEVVSHCVNRAAQHQQSLAAIAKKEEKSGTQFFVGWPEWASGRIKEINEALKGKQLHDLAAALGQLRAREAKKEKVKLRIDGSGIHKQFFVDVEGLNRSASKKQGVKIIHKSEEVLSGLLDYLEAEFNDGQKDNPDIQVCIGQLERSNWWNKKVKPNSKLKQKLQKLKELTAAN
jgi:predicted  nucleic acid-binding Zn-ribbon protein